MKTIKFLIAILFATGLTNSRAQDTWTEKADCGGLGREMAVGFSIGSKGYIGTGLNGTSTFLSDFWEYDPSTNAWTQKADFGGGVRYQAVGFSIGNKGYVGTGGKEGNVGYNDFWEYDPSTNGWTRKADFGGIGRRNAVGFSIGSKGYIGTGGGDFNFEKDFWEYDPATDVWTKKADFKGAGRLNAAGFSIGSKGYIGTGVGQSYYKDFWEYNPATDKWIQKADFAGGERYTPVGFSIGTKGYIGLGFFDLNDFWEYDPATNGWTQKANFGGTGRAYATGFSIADKGYMGTGVYPVGVKDFWEYTPDYIPNDSTPVIASITDINSSQAVVHWNAVPNISSYMVRVYPEGTKKYRYLGIISPITDTFKKIFNLKLSTQYKVEVMSLFANNTDSSDWSAPVSFTTEGYCNPPTGLKVNQVSDTGVRLRWTRPVTPISHSMVWYRAISDSVWKIQLVPPTKDFLFLTGLSPNTAYQWQVKSGCISIYDRSNWVEGPDFTTTASFASSSTTSAITSSKLPGNIHVQIMPNPNKGDFTIQLQLPPKAAITTLALYNNRGEKVWQQDAGRISGAVYKNISLQNQLPAGIYMMVIQRNDVRLMQKIVISK